MSNADRPLVKKLIEFQQENPMSFHVPGHKYGELSGLPPAIRSALAYDVTELNGLDDLHQPEDVIKEAQEKLADFYEADASYFLVNGSTVGNLAMIYATCSAGDFVIVQRNAHKSIFNALELVQAKPILVTPKWNEFTSTVGVLTEEQVSHALYLYPQAKAVILTYPTYYGTSGDDLGGIVEVCHKQQIPVLVDEAHGAHFAIGEPFPRSALTLGADIVVHSAHKTLPAMTMASFLHIKSSLVAKERVEKYLQMLQSSSPSYLLMASLDDARAYIACYGQVDIEYFIKKKADLIQQLTRNVQLEVVTSDDPLKLMIRVQGYTGFQLLDALEKEGIYVELADPYQVLFVLPLLKEQAIYQIEEIVDKVERAVQSLLKSTGEIKSIQSLNLGEEVTELCYNRDELEKFQSAWVDYEEAIGKVAAAAVIPYPPGIPLLLAGERVSEEAVKSLIALTNMKASFQGAICTKEKQIFVVMNEVGE